jgi:hypothetical protein
MVMEPIAGNTLEIDMGAAAASLADIAADLRQRQP